MRIIEENKTEEIIYTCNRCGCKFAYTADDIFTNIYGKAIECPSCGKEIVLERFDHLMQFPNSYFHFGGKDSKIIDNETIEKEAKRGIKYCLEHNEHQWYTAYGNMFVEVNWMTDEDNSFSIIVAQNYYENDISEEEAKELITNFNY